MAFIQGDSPLVCQIPGCTTTQTEIETELTTFMTSYCSVCKKDRGGKLCSCAFPCSLTFKSQMLNKIHELLGIGKPFDRRAIQVCFKHPDLLKQAREACVAKRDENNRLKRRIPSSVSTEVTKTKSAKITTNQQKMCKIQFQDYESDSDNEEFDDVISEKNCSRSLPITSTSHTSQSVNIKFHLDDVCSDNDPNREPLENEVVHEVIEHDDDDLERKLCEIFGPDVQDEDSRQSSASSNSASNFQFSLHTDAYNSGKEMKIKYQDYYERILTSEMKSLMHQSYLNDVQFICKDGDVFANCLILGSMSNYLYSILADIPVVDKVKVVIMPDVSSVDLNSLFKLLFNPDATKSVSFKDMRRIKSIAAVFKLEPILILTRKPGRPKGSPSKPKKISQTQVISTDPVQESETPLHILGKGKMFPGLERHEMGPEPDDNGNASELVAIYPQNPGQGTTHMVVTPSENSMVSIPQDVPHQEVLLELEVPRNPNDPNINLLPTNDLLDQIVQNTS